MLTTLQNGSERLKRLVSHFLQEEGKLEIALVELDAYNAMHVLQHFIVLIRHRNTAKIVAKPTISGPETLCTTLRAVLDVQALWQT